MEIREIRIQYKTLEKENLSSNDKDVLEIFNAILKKVETPKYGNWITCDGDRIEKNGINNSMYSIDLPLYKYPPLRDAKLIFDTRGDYLITCTIDIKIYNLRPIYVPKDFRTDKSGYYKKAIALITNTIKTYKDLERNFIKIEKSNGNF